ncbi:MAG TPA: GAF domain-containing protein [Opitutaceae bacterium]|nr:GAF domain-containing protein [Opitutaceae bacterium]
MTDETDLTALSAISSIASGTDDPGAATREILALISRTFESDSGLVALQNPESRRLEIEAGLGLPADAERSFTPGQGVPGWVAWHGRPLLVPDSSGDPRSRPMRGETRCEMAAPLMLPDGRVLGVVALDRDLPGSYGARDLERLVRLSDEAARVLSRLWELRHLRGKARQLEALIATGQALVGKLEQRELFDTLTRDASAMMQAHACAFFLHDPRSASLRLASYTGVAETLSPEGDLPLRSCLFASAVNARKPVTFADVRSPECLDLQDLPRDPAIQSVLAAPMLFEGDVLGILAIFMDRPRLFDDDEKRLCSALASLGAVALQNSRLYARVFASEESLRKNERLTTLGLLAAEIAHEIRNPLTVLKLLHGGLGLDFAEGDPRRTDMRVIGEKLDQLEAIVTRVLNFAKAPTSLHSRYQVAEIVEDTLVLIRLKLAQSKIRVSFEPPARSIVIEGHKGQLQQVLLNLLINSMQAMPEGGEITLRLACETRGSASWAVLDVEDTGSGIPDALRGRIFDSFLTGRTDGTGLGLAIAKRILQGHNGDIQLVSSSPAGTAFQVTLPLARG